MKHGGNIVASDRQRGLKTGRAEGASASDDGAVASSRQPNHHEKRGRCDEDWALDVPVSAGLGNAAI